MVERNDFKNFLTFLASALVCFLGSILLRLVYVSIYPVTSPNNSLPPFRRFDIINNHFMFSIGVNTLNKGCRHLPWSVTTKNRSRNDSRIPLSYVPFPSLMFPLWQVISLLLSVDHFYKIYILLYQLFDIILIEIILIQY